MASVMIVYWRDIPAQVLARAGRRRERRQLSERFEQAIDRAAMRAGAKDEDAYLADWRKSDPIEIDGDPAVIVASEASRLEEEYPRERILALIARLGWED